MLNYYIRTILRKAGSPWIYIKRWLNCAEKRFRLIWTLKPAFSGIVSIQVCNLSKLLDSHAPQSVYWTIEFEPWIISFPSSKITGWFKSSPRDVFDVYQFSLHMISSKLQLNRVQGETLELFGSIGNGGRKDGQRLGLHVHNQEIGYVLDVFMGKGSVGGQVGRWIIEDKHSRGVSSLHLDLRLAIFLVNLHHPPHLPVVAHLEVYLLIHA